MDRDQWNGRYSEGYGKGYVDGYDIGMMVGHEDIATHIIDHPELGAVLDSQCGAQSKGCAYDTPDKARSAAPAWLDAVLRENEALWAKGQPGSIRGAVLASDGWWWKV